MTICWESNICWRGNRLKKLLFIFNPLAGKARIRNRLFDILEYYTQHNFLVSMYPTQGAGDAYAFITNMEDPFDLIICSGGDGTLNEVVSGIVMSNRKLVLGYIPSGSTNDFGRSVGISTDLEEALKITCNGTPFAIDIGCFSGHYFVYVAAFGIFTNISYSTPQRMKNSLGYFAYILKGIKALSELKAYEVVMQYDGGIVSGRFIMGLITNSFSVGGFKTPSYHLTKLNDGLFEVLLIRMPQSIIELQAIVTALLNEKVDQESIICVQTSNVKIESESIEWTFDGEYGGRFEKASVTNLNKAISMLVAMD